MPRLSMIGPALSLKLFVIDLLPRVTVVYYPWLARFSYGELSRTATLFEQLACQFSNRP